MFYFCYDQKVIRWYFTVIYVKTTERTLLF